MPLPGAYCFYIVAVKLPVMAKVLRFISCMVFLGVFSTAGVLAQQDSIPESIGRINDYEGILTSKEIRSLNNFLMKYEIKTSRQVAILTIERVPQGHTMKDFALTVANTWGIGQSDSNNGLLIVVSKNSREARIATGLGTARVLTDDVCKDILDNTMIPEFKKDQYYKGLMNGLKKIVKMWK